MNKIEKAIYLVKQRLAKLETDRLLVIHEIDIMKNQLDILEDIQLDKSIKHIQEDTK